MTVFNAAVVVANKINSVEELKVNELKFSRGAQIQ